MKDRSSTVLARSGSYSEALSYGQSLLDEDPAAALKQADALIQAKADPQAFRLAASALLKLGRTEECQGAELAAIKAGTADPELRAAALADADGRSDEARQIAQGYLDAHPDDLLARTLLAEASLKLWDLEAAERLLRSVLARAPTFLRASLTLAECLATQARMQEAIDVSHEILGRKPGNLLALVADARYLAEVGKIGEATSRHETLAKLDGRRPARWVTLAHHYRMGGRRDDAIRAFRQALKVDPDNGSSWWGLANYFMEALDERDRAAIRASLERQAGTPSEGPLHLALGLIADRKGDHAKAFDHFVAGNEIQLEAQPYDPAPISSAVDSGLALATREFYDRRSKAGCPDPSPIFIIGMQRSGTTLVERILGRHPSIEGIGELKILPRLAEWLRHRVGAPKHSAAILEASSDAQLSWLGERYVQASADFRDAPKPFFIDKNNLNWMHVGLILLAMPNARIIDVRRNALDCCWANFKMLYAEGFPATNDLRHVGQFYRDYARLVDGMTDIAPNRILRVRYEELVDNIEGETRRMLDFLGLDYDSTCIDFHLSTDAVATASSEQVRQPLNRRGIGSAEPYRQWLGPLIEELGPLAKQELAADRKG